MIAVSLPAGGGPARRASVDSDRGRGICAGGVRDYRAMRNPPPHPGKWRRGPWGRNRRLRIRPLVRFHGNPSLPFVTAPFAAGKSLPRAARTIPQSAISGMTAIAGKCGAIREGRIAVCGRDRSRPVRGSCGFPSFRRWSISSGERGIASRCVSYPQQSLLHQLRLTP